MKQCEVKNCTDIGQKHHIVHRSRGGLDIDLNYKYLCINHHTYGKQAIHNNRAFELAVKRELQATYFDLFTAEQYTVQQIAKIIGIKPTKLEKAMKNVSNTAGAYQQEDAIRFLMGGKLY